MTIEFKDKRNITLIPLSDLADGDHFIYNNIVWVVNDHDYDPKSATCVNIDDGSICDLLTTIQVQQVSLVIEIHLV